MSQRRQGSTSDDLATLTVGCLLAILGLFTFGVFRALRYKPQAYSPVGLDEPTQQSGKDRMPAPWWSLLLVFGIGVPVSYALFDNAMKSHNVTTIVLVVGGIVACLGRVRLPAGVVFGLWGTQVGGGGTACGRACPGCQVRGLSPQGP